MTLAVTVAPECLRGHTASNVLVAMCLPCLARRAQAPDSSWILRGAKPADFRSSTNKVRSRDQPYQRKGPRGLETTAHGLQSSRSWPVPPRFTLNVNYPELFNG
jgi:hypothetical protein